MLNEYRKNLIMMTVTLITFILASCNTLFSNSACSSQEPIRPSGSPHYQLTKLKRKDLALPPVVYGQLTSEIGLSTLKIAAVRVKRTIVSADTAGVYYWKGNPGTYIFIGRCVGYADVASEKIRLTKGNSIILNFRLPTGPPDHT
jgi:hypothetical protein